MNQGSLSGDGFDRRRFVLASAATVACLALRAHGIGPPRPRPADRLASLFAASPSAHILGLAYLAGHPEDRDAASLRRQLSATLPGGPRTLVRASDADLRLAVRERIAEDFAQARTVLVDGWLLARTEGRLFALAVLGP